MSFPKTAWHCSLKQMLLKKGVISGFVGDYSQLWINAHLEHKCVFMAAR